MKHPTSRPGNSLEQTFIVVGAFDHLAQGERALPDAAQEGPVSARDRERDSTGRHVLDALDSEPEHVHRVLRVESVRVDELGTIGVTGTAHAEQPLALRS